MAGKRKPIGQMLIDKGAVDKGQILRALEYQQKSGEKMRLGEILVKYGFCGRKDVLKCLAEQFDVPYLDLSEARPQIEAIDAVPRNVAKAHNILPLEKENGAITVAIGDLDLCTIDNLRFILDQEIRPVLAAPEEITAAIEHFYGAEESTVDGMLRDFTESEMSFAQLDEHGGVAGEGEEGEEAPIIRLVTMIISEAVRSRASDIHVEPLANRIRIRYRIDGVCIEVESPPKRLQQSILARLKLMAGMDIAEKRKCQDGRIAIKINGRPIDLRVSALPATNGESMVMRILDKESIKVKLSELGFHESDYKRFTQIIRRPNGIFLVTGPTGSGKTTTLYASLNELNRPDRKIITAEDPVEYNLGGINQCEVHDKIGRGFAVLLRSMLRQAPNIILVGEIRDVETAEIAVTAALTGHLVFSTLHTNDASSAIARLIDIGVKPFLVASAVQAIMAQRLVRKICENCKEPHEYGARELMAVGLKPDDIEGITLYRGGGCAHCKGTGYRGRMAIVELLEMNNELREMAFRRAPTQEIRARARALGMLTLLEDGVRKVLQGRSTIEEVLRIAGSVEEEA
jgi:type IV pilus assembly protein PilB